MTTVPTTATTSLPGWLSAGAGWLPTPADADPEATRQLALMLAGGPVSVVVHALYVPLFALWGVWPLAVFNVFATAMYVVVMLTLRYRPQQALLFAAAEQVVHAILVVLLIGWGFGGQYYLISLGVFVFGVSWPRRFQFAYLIGAIALFSAGYYYTQATVPPYEVPAVPLAVLNVLNIGTVFAIITLTVTYLIAVTRRSEAALAVEHARSERLLTNVLPVPIAERLKEHEEVIADGVDGASVLFADIVGFTVLSAQRPPDEVVAM